MTKLEDFKNETWEEEYNGRPATYEQVVGNSGIYLVVTDKKTGKIVRDDRPWQMREGLS